MLSMGSRNEVVNGMTSTCGKASQVIESRSVFVFLCAEYRLRVVGRYRPISGIGTLISLQFGDRAGNPSSFQFPRLEFSA